MNAFVARKGFDPVYGARPLRRYVQHELETRLGRALVAGDVSDEATGRVDIQDDELAMSINNPRAEAVTA
jgi:ATP-dependent Clp protease ATP-binding subunit ClpB